MIQITGTERGTIYSRAGVQPYTRTYTQPIHNFVIGWTYENVWEKLTWRILRFFERFQMENPEWHHWKNVPYVVRQELRCDYLRHKNRTYTQELQRSDKNDDGTQH